MATVTAREAADARFGLLAGSALAAVLRNDEPRAKQLIGGMFPHRKRELADAAERLAELAEEG